MMLMLVRFVVLVVVSFPAGISASQAYQHPPVAISLSNGVANIQWYGQLTDTHYSIKGTSDLRSGYWTNLVAGELGLGQTHLWSDMSATNCPTRFYWLRPWSEFSGTTSDSGIFTFQLGDAETRVFVSDMQNRPLSNISVQVQVVSSNCLVQAFDATGKYFSGVAVKSITLPLLHLALQARELVPVQDPTDPQAGSSADIVPLSDDYFFIPSDLTTFIYTGLDAEALLDSLAALEEPSWKTYARGGKKVADIAGKIYKGYKIVRFASLGNPVTLMVTVVFGVAIDEYLQPESDKWFNRVNTEAGMVIMQNDGTLPTHGYVAGLVEDRFGKRVSDFSVSVADLPMANILTTPQGAYIVDSIFCVPDGTDYTVTVTPTPSISIHSFLASSHLPVGKDVWISAFIRSLNPASISVNVTPGSVVDGAVTLDSTIRDDLSPVVRYRTIGSSAGWSSVALTLDNTKPFNVDYEGEIPGEAIGYPGVEAFIEVTDGAETVRTEVWQFVVAENRITIDSSPTGATIGVNGGFAGITLLSIPVEVGDTLTASIPNSTYPVQERTVTTSDLEDGFMLFDFEGHRSITVAAPAAVTIQGGSIATISWATVGSVPVVDVLYRTDPASHWQPVAYFVDNHGSLHWMVPNIYAANAQIKVRASSDNRIRGISPGSFRIDRTNPEPARIVTPPQDITAASGEQATFTVVAAGTEPLMYRWSHGDEPVGANASLTVTAGEATAGTYTVVVSNDYGSASASATLTVTNGVSPPGPSGMVLIPGGTNSGTDPDFGAYSLTVTSFYMDRYEVTKALWDEVYTWAMANGYGFDNAGGGKGANHPVHSVNWYDVVKWCNARSQREGRPAVYTVNGSAYKTGRHNNVVQTSVAGYRLPTDTEWEYAARGELSGRRFPWGDTITHSRANYNSHSGYSYDISPTRGYHPTYSTGGHPYTSPVGSFAANGYGLYDMAGNVWEWCFDWYPGYEGSHRVLRGGGWSYDANSCRVASRGGVIPDYGWNDIGFRAVLPPGQQ